ncbi:hypothetical protein Bca52824_042257 [Brassica carinata]|uniref:AB hydrolase-1 domain-containing protein n=1 Tax=Brassica carinata TaxID=52824 RepID=A0A8X7RWZ7_BRACI|nr:hypothetical protein Bca52824_042257 [Brassica carinata]
MTRLEEIQTLEDYCKPLLEFLSSLCSDDEKVILVAHSMGGVSAALAADIFPCKIAAIVFLTGFMPDTRNPPAYVYEKHSTRGMVGHRVGKVRKPDCPLDFALLGPKFLAKKVYQLSPLFLNQDVESKEGNGEGEPEAVCARPWALPRRVDLVQTENAVEAAGHCVTAVDLAASGINMTRLDEIPTLVDYSKPLLDILSSLGSDEDKVILVAHSMGGIPVALAADIFPSKISAIVFVTSFMPDTRNPPAYVLENLSSTSQMDWLDTVTGFYGHLISMAKYAYQLSPLEDLVLATMLVRVNPVVTNNLAGTKSFSEERYGSVTRIYIICGEDNMIPEDYQRWMISNFPVKEVMEIKDADHMAMFSKPQELCARLVGIANKYA